MDDEDDIGCTLQRHVPAFDFFRPFLALALFVCYFSHTFQCIFWLRGCAAAEKEGAMTSDFAAQKSRPTLVPSSQTIAVEPSVDILASLVRPSNAVHSRTHSHSHCSAESSTAFPLSLSLSF